jgi:non-ribosomal peptide synthetase component F
MFVLHTATPYALTLPGLTVQPWDSETSVYRQTLQATTFDLILILQERSEGLFGSCVYQTTLFNAETIQRILVNYQRVLERIWVSPQQPLHVFTQDLTSGR